MLPNHTKYFFLFVSCCFVLISKAQVVEPENNIWYFGGKDSASLYLPGAAIDFTTGTPVALTDNVLSAMEGSAVQSNSVGSLLFYTNGEDVYARNHILMPNGAGLGGNFSSTQSSVIIPFTNDTNKFYLFALTGQPTAGYTGLHYSIIDMTLNNGFGDVTATKAVQLLPLTSECLTAVYHADQQEYWIITSKWDSSLIYAYKVNAFGIAPPVITDLELDSIEMWPEFVFNNQGNRLVIFTRNQVFPWPFTRYLADFDQTSGIVSNLVAFDTTFAGIGTVFSPNDHFLYSGVMPASFQPELYQYDVTATNITASRQLIYTYPAYPSPSGMKRGPDGKIYIAHDSDSLDIISSPNTSGSACNYQRNALFLGGRPSGNNLPNTGFPIRIIPQNVTEQHVNTPFPFCSNPGNGAFILSSPQDYKNIVICNSVGAIVRILNENELRSGTQMEIILTPGLYIVSAESVDAVRYCGRIIIY